MDRTLECPPWCCWTSSAPAPTRSRVARSACAGRSLQGARRAGPGDHALRRAEVVRGHHPGRRRRRVQRQPETFARRIADLRVTGPSLPSTWPPGSDCRVDRRRGARLPDHPRVAGRRAPGPRRPRPAGARSRTPRRGAAPPELASTENDLRARVDAVKAREQRAHARPTTPCSSACATPARDRRVVEDARVKAGAWRRRRSPRLVPGPAASTIRRPRVRRVVDGETGHLRADALAALDAVAGRVQTGKGDDASALFRPEPPAGLPLEPASASACRRGSKASSLRPRKTAEISVNGKRLKAAIADLVVLGRPGAPPPATVRVNVTMASSESGARTSTSSAARCPRRSSAPTSSSTRR